jgi:Protein of unknown function (DUF3089)
MQAHKAPSMARKFLYIFATLIVLVIAGAFAYRMFPNQIMRAAFAPTAKFEVQKPATTNAYADKTMWIARPDIPGNPALWGPDLLETDNMPNHATFFIHPTSYLARAHWNAPLDDKEANDRAALFVRGQASVFNKSQKVWAPRYRQAAFGAFLTDAPEATRALDAAYGDVAAAFDHFIASIDPKTPIILAGHSQGSLHLLRLLEEKVAGKPVAKRIAAAYIIGWPIAMKADLPALGLPACNTPEQSGCILAWQSFGEPADYSDIIKKFEATPSLTGLPRTGDTLLCTNPVSGTIGGTTPASANLGTLKNKADFSDGRLVAGAAAARCDAKGFLLIGENPPNLGPYVLPGNNYHVYDYSLFWTNIRSDVERRAQAFAGG